MTNKKTTLLRKLSCTIGDQCPAVEHVEGGRFRVTGTNVDDPANEATVEVPDALFPELTSLEIHDWPRWLKAHRKKPGDMLRIQTRRNLHVIRQPLSGYLRYAFEWGYAYNVRNGQDVRILDAAEHPPAAWMFRTGDYWVVEGQHVVLCRYSCEGVPQGLVEIGAGGAAGFVAAGEMAWQLGTPFTEWWATHTEYHREPTAA